MNESPLKGPAAAAFSPVAVLGVGRAGAAMVAQMRAAGVPAEACCSVFSRHAGETSPAETGVLALAACALEAFSAAPATTLAALDPGLAEAVRRTCTGRQWVLVLTGLGGRTGSALAPLVAADARQSCRRVIAFATLPGAEEGGERGRRGRRALAGLSGASAGVFCLAHDQLPDATEAPGPLTAMFELPGQLLAAAAHGVWRMLTATPFIRLHADELCQHLKGAACRTFAAVDATGTDRAQVAVQKLLAHPLLASGSVLRGTKVVVSVAGGADLSRADVRQVVQGVEGAAEGVRVVLSAATTPEMTGRLGITLFARSDAPGADEAPEEDSAGAAATRFVPGNELSGAPPLGTRTQSQTTEGARIETSAPTTRRRATRSPQQAQLPLELLQRGRFEKSEPTIHNGENLDLPTYIRHGITLN